VSPLPTVPLLAVDGLSVDFVNRRGRTAAVGGVSFTVHRGECLAIVGRSGSGKSVTARALLGLTGTGSVVRADVISFDGVDLTALDDAAWRRIRGRQIGYVLQDALGSLDPLRRVGDEVREPLDVHRLASRKERAALAVGLLRDVGVPAAEQRARQYPHELSGGLRQRALIASALAANPSLIIADEPTTALDVTVQAQVLSLLASKRDQGTALLLISHDLTVVAGIADRVAVMEEGRIIEEGAVQRVLDAPRHAHTAALLAAAPALPFTPGSGVPVGAVTSGCPVTPLRSAGARETAGREIGSRGGVAAVPTAAVVPLVDVRSVTKRFRTLAGHTHVAVRDVSLQLQTATAVGIVGESGSGKTTLTQLILGMTEPDSGEVYLDGQRWSGRRERDRRPARPRMQAIYQDPLSSFDPRFTVARIVGEALGRAALGGGTGEGADDRRWPVRGGAGRDAAAALLAEVGLGAGLLDRHPAQLSGGERQRVAIARALAPHPDVLICDEPVSALDVFIQAQILNLLGRVRQERKMALLFVSHDLAVVSQVCDQVVVMKDGAVVEAGDVPSVFSAPQHPYTRSLLDAVAPGGVAGRREATAT
jgi:peptide/nickel transport system ATP-binding protein